MTEKTLTFKERLELKAKMAQQPPTVELPKEEPKAIEKPKRFGQPKEQAQPEPTPETEAKPVSKFGGFKKTITAPTIEVVVEPVVEEKRQEEAGPLPKVIQAFNTVGGATAPTEGELLSGHGGDEAVRRIQEKIKDLSVTDNQTDLKYEMQKLSEMLVANPAACLYLLDEDLGMAVQAMRKLTNNRAATDLANAKPSKASKERALTSKPMDAQEMQSAFDAL